MSSFSAVYPTDSVTFRTASSISASGSTPIRFRGPDTLVPCSTSENYWDPIDRLMARTVDDRLAHDDVTALIGEGAWNRSGKHRHVAQPPRT